MSIKLSLTKRPEAWQSITVAAGKDARAATVRVRYHLLSEGELRRLRREPLERYQSSDSDTARIDALVDELSDQAAEARKQLLVERILDWDIEDADAGGKLAVTPEHVRAACEGAVLFRALYEGLLDASAAPVKKT